MKIIRSSAHARTASGSELAATVFIILCEKEGFFFADDLFDFTEAMKRDSAIHGQSYWIQPKFAISSLKPDMYVGWFDAFI
jgi:hypothetical protein